MHDGVDMSMRLYFLRHGQAENRHTWQENDSSRPLTADGESRMEREAAGIRGLGLALNLIIASPLVRAFRTAEIVASGQEPHVRLVRDGRLGPGFGPEHLAGILADHRRAKALMLVGHEPDFSETIGRLTGGRIVMKKGALACVELEDPASLKGTLIFLVPSKVLER